MSNLKEKLIRLGEQRPGLRRHLRPILKSITQKRGSEDHKVYAYFHWNVDLPLGRDMGRTNDWIGISEAYLGDSSVFRSYERAGDRVSVEGDRNEGIAEIWTSSEDFVYDFKGDLEFTLRKLLSKEHPHATRGDDIYNMVHVELIEQKNIG